MTEEEQAAIKQVTDAFADHDTKIESLHVHLNMLNAIMKMQQEALQLMVQVLTDITNREGAVKLTSEDQATINEIASKLLDF